ncbi:Predicted methyltransferase [Duganella sp. CF402]|uniref:class I SAM-dependent methyltransferase n=1 Tax=unclassified Duganella TaxID=2636909 RepID=UPI0008CB160D|nr:MULTISPECIES: methyltransferase [unclassified Duganella]RZT08731.1 putative methyltransferase [Duganella sp. BK701]SEL83832.1 Predicted methyltransferase [Duganella sp. CF402]
MKSALFLKSTLAMLALTPLLLSLPAQAQTPSSAVTDKARPEKDVQQDSVRLPAELLAFSKVKKGDVVVDIWPGGGYWSRLFSTLVGPNGKVYAYVPAEITGFKSDPLALAKAISSEPGHGNVEATSYPAAEQPQTDLYNKVDVFWTFENYHDLHDSFMKGADVNAFNQAVFKRLKPGGYYIVADHAAVAGSGLKNTEDLHRIDPEAVKAEVLKAGFVLDGETTVLAVPGDDHQLKIFDPAVRGKTDRFVLRFKKPSH